VKKAVQIDERDNVATATSDVEEGEAVEVLSPEGVVIMRPKASDPIPFGHKLALVDLGNGDDVVKYGEIIGVASRRISIGEWVHTHNVESATVPTSAYKGESS
jgi:predicted RecA/RadA family phage recombinase